MSTESTERVEAIRQRVDSPQSFGYGVTHYQDDVRFLLSRLALVDAVVEAAEVLSYRNEVPAGWDNLQMTLTAYATARRGT